jgi:hypothetical protein
MKVGTKGRRYTLDGVKQDPRKFVCRDAFKWANFIIAWAKGDGEGHLTRAEKWLEERVLNCGISMIRAPHDYTFWTKGPRRIPTPSGYGLVKEDFWATPSNHTNVVDLTQRPGGTFKLSQLERKVIKKMAKVALKHGIIIDHPWLWTIKHYERGFGDPRKDQREANIWNEHYIAAVGRYLSELRDELGGLPFLNEIANEFNTVHPELTERQIGDICARWHTRDVKGEILGIDQAGPPVDWRGNEVPYKPKLRDGARSPDDIRLHPARDVELPWWKIGMYVQQYFREYMMPVYIDEPILLMPRKAYDALPMGDGWRFLGTKSRKRYGEMVEDLWSRGFYVCIHDGGADSGSRHGGGVSAGWVPGFEDLPGEIDDFIKELLGIYPPPPPPPPPPPSPGKTWWEKLIDWLKGLFKRGS